MKNITILLILVVCSFSAKAQIASRVHRVAYEQDAVSFHALNQAKYREARPTGLRQRNVGRTLTIGGLALGFAGVMVYSDARKGRTINNGQVTQSPEDYKATLGILMVEGGLGMFIPGVILWKKGQKKYNRWLEQQSVSLHTTGSGILLRYSF